MPRVHSQYVAFVESVNYRIGRIAMYGFFVMLGVLLPVTELYRSLRGALKRLVF